MIRLDNVFKFYRTHATLKVVLDHVTVHFEPGYNYAILGVNGAGKSTTMRIMAGSELPNGGTVRRTCRVSWPLGFASLHSKMTGRENVKFVAQIYGEDPRRVIRFVEEFAEIGSYIEAPVHTYSSGMFQRLAFGLSMAVEFECYLIDEVIAVGDARFQARCREEFDKRREKANIVMVSHDMHAIRTYCQRAAVLADGQMMLFHNLDDAIETYRRMNA